MFTLKSIRSLASLLVLFAALLIAGAAWGEENMARSKYKAPGHDEFHHWYQMIQTELDILGKCCDNSNQDCGPVEDYEIVSAEVVQVLLEDGNWYIANSNTRIYYVDTPDERAHACRRPVTNERTGKSAGEGYALYCIFLPLRGV